MGVVLGLKEWQPIVAASRRGQLTLLMRKGGVLDTTDADARAAGEHRRHGYHALVPCKNAMLIPTTVHAREASKMLKIHGVEEEGKPCGEATKTKADMSESSVFIDTLARVTAAWSIPDIDSEDSKDSGALMGAIQATETFHGFDGRAWRKSKRGRRRSRGDGMEEVVLIELRVYKLHEDVGLEISRERSCQSWITPNLIRSRSGASLPLTDEWFDAIVGSKNASPSLCQEHFCRRQLKLRKAIDGLNKSIEGLSRHRDSCRFIDCIFDEYS